MPATRVAFRSLHIWHENSQSIRDRLNGMTKSICIVAHLFDHAGNDSHKTVILRAGSGSAWDAGHAGIGLSFGCTPTKGLSGTASPIDHPL
jgi:hypothetical protein